MTNQERIAAYFDNELAPAEQEELFRQLEQDPTLKSEFDFQQEVVDGIQEFRKQELIARLNNVKIASGGQSILLKTLGMLGTAAIISGGLFWYFSPTEEAKPNKETVIIEDINPSTPQQNEQVEVSKSEPDLTEDKPVVEKATPVTTKKTPKDVAQSNPPKVVVPDMVEPGIDKSTTLEEDLTAPEAMASESISIKNATEVAVKLNKKYKFHYQVTSGNLTLYGDFSDFPFEVIELKTTEGISSYLYYKSYFYQLENDSDEIRPLIPIDNQALIDELNRRR